MKDGDHKYIERLPSFLIVDVLLDLSDIERFPSFLIIDVLPDLSDIERLLSFLIVDVLLDLSDIERFAQGSADRKCRMIAAGA